MIDEKRAMTIARKAFGLTLTSMPDTLYVLINEAIKDEKERCVAICTAVYQEQSPVSDYAMGKADGALDCADAIEGDDE